MARNTVHDQYLISYLFYLVIWNLFHTEITPEEAAQQLNLNIVTVHLLHHGILLFSFLRRTHLLFGMYSYDWIHTLILLSSLNSSFVEL